MNRAAVDAVLGGRTRYDDVPSDAQAAVRIAWEREIVAAISELNFEPGLIAEGGSWAESDERGRLVVRSASGVDRGDDDSTVA